MSFFSWLACAIGNRRSVIGSGLRKPKIASRKPPRFRPQLEALEDRWLPSTLTVLNNLDSGAGSLRAGIAAANPGDTINFAPSLNGQTIILTSGELSINKNLTIQGPGAGQLTISSTVNGQGVYGSRLFEVDGAMTRVNLSGMTINRGGGTAFSGGSPSHPYDSDGGAILNFGNLTISGCTLTNNRTYNAGGAIYNAGTLTVSGSFLSLNNAYGYYGNGGGIYNLATMTVSSSYLQGNSAGSHGDGGAIYNAPSATATITGTNLAPASIGNTLVYNTAWVGAGIWNDGTMTLNRSSVHFSQAKYQAGGIYNGRDGHLTIQSSYVTGNYANGIESDLYNLGQVTISSDSHVG
jgi:hypothetical protein